MKRRQFFKVGAVGAAAVGSASCATLGGTQLLEGPTMSDGEVDGFLATLERGLRAIDTADFTGKLVPRVDPQQETQEERAERQRADGLARKALRALLLTGMVQDLAPGDKRHPKVQQKVLDHLPELDDAVLGMTGYLDSLTPRHHAQLRRRLRDEPELGLRISEELDAPAKASGVPLDTRLKTRAMITHIAWRMRSQNPALLFDEYRDKVTRIGTRSGQAEQIRRVMATRMSEEAFWRHEERMARLYAQAQGGSDDEPGVTRPKAGPAPASSPASAPAAAPLAAPPGAVPPRATPAPPAYPPAGAYHRAGGPCSASCTKKNLCVPDPETGNCVECVADIHCAANPAAQGQRCNTDLNVCVGADGGGLDNEARREVRRQKGNKVMKAGGWIAGGGAVALGIGGIIVAAGMESGAWIVGAIIMTVGGLALLGGLITLLVGGIIRASA